MATSHQKPRDALNAQSACRGGYRPSVTKKPVVLIVEGEALVRRGAVECIVFAGCEALEADNADRAIEIFQTRPDTDLVFTDVGMPGTLDRLKLVHYTRGKWPPVYMIVASGLPIEVAEIPLPVGAKFF